MLRVFVSFLFLLVALPAYAQKVENPVAEFAGLDKITGRIIKFDVKMNETVQFGALQVTPRACYTRASSDTPQTTTFIEVDELTLKNEIRRIFSGWMFADSPGLNAVEHPIYDIWLNDCKGGKAIVKQQGPTPGYEGESPKEVENPIPTQQRKKPQ